MPPSSTSRCVPIASSRIELTLWRRAEPGIAASIGLVPFDNLSGDPAQDVLAMGFVEDIAAALSRFESLEVMYPRAVASTMPGRGGSGSIPATANVLRVTVRRAGDVIRITVQLLDAETGRQLCADRHDITAGNLFAVQDQIAEQVASALAICVDRSRRQAAQRNPLDSLEAYDCWLRGFECLQRGTTEADREARTFERAIEINPTYGRAYAGLSLSHFNDWSCQSWYKWDKTERLAYKYARRAAALDGSDAIVQVVLGRLRCIVASSTERPFTSIVRCASMPTTPRSWFTRRCVARTWGMANRRWRWARKRCA